MLCLLTVANWGFDGVFDAVVLLTNFEVQLEHSCVLTDVSELALLLTGKQ